MKKELGANYYCDICEKEFFSPNGYKPDCLAYFKMEFKRSGFDYHTIMDCCQECLPPSFFRDPCSKELMPKSLFKKILDSLTFKDT